VVWVIMDMNKDFRGLTPEQRLYKDRLNVAKQLPELITKEDKAILDEAAIHFFGDGHDLERALGAFILGKYAGWKVLRILHDGSTYAKYERILGAGKKGVFKFKNHCPERGPIARRFRGLVWADKINRFWEVVRGQVPGARSPTVELDPQLPDDVG
jgi:hypothetical protein